DSGQCRKRYANLGYHARNDELLAPGAFVSVDKILIIPGVDLAWTLNILSVMESFLEFRNQRAIGATLETCRANRRQLEILAAGCQREHVILELIGRQVLHQ